jgi:hypothetical protein
MANLAAIASEEHAILLKRRDLFLRKHPELIPLQKKIDERLGGARSEHNRLVLIHEMMMDSVKVLAESLKLMIRSLRELDRRIQALGMMK